MAKLINTDVDAAFPANAPARPDITFIRALLNTLLGHLYNPEIIDDARTGALTLGEAEAGLPRRFTHAGGASITVPADAPAGRVHELIQGGGALVLAFAPGTTVYSLGGRTTTQAVGERLRLRCIANPGGTSAHWQFWGAATESALPDPPATPADVPQLPRSLAGAIAWTALSAIRHEKRAVSGTSVTDTTNTAVETLALANAYLLPSPADEATRGGSINRGVVEFWGSAAARLILPPRPALGFSCLINLTNANPGITVEPADTRASFSLNGRAAAAWAAAPLQLGPAPGLYLLVNQFTSPNVNEGADWALHELPQAIASARWGNPAGGALRVTDADLVLTRGTMRKFVNVFNLTADRSVYLPEDLTAADDGAEVLVKFGDARTSAYTLFVRQGATAIRSLRGGLSASFVWNGADLLWERAGNVPAIEEGGFHIPASPTTRFAAVVHDGATAAAPAPAWGGRSRNPGREYFRVVNLAQHPTNSLTLTFGLTGDGEFLWLYNAPAGPAVPYPGDFTVNMPTLQDGVYSGARFVIALMGLSGTGRLLVQSRNNDGTPLGAAMAVPLAVTDRAYEFTTTGDNTWWVVRHYPLRISGPTGGYVVPAPGATDGLVPQTSAGNYILGAVPSPAELQRDLAAGGYVISGYRAGVRNQALPYTLIPGDTGQSLNLTGSGALTVPAATTLLAGFDCEVVNDTGADVLMDGPGAADMILPADQIGAVKVRNGRVRIVGSASAV